MLVPRTRAYHPLNPFRVSALDPSKPISNFVINLYNRSFKISKLHPTHVQQINPGFVFQALARNTLAHLYLPYIPPKTSYPHHAQLPFVHYSEFKNKGTT